MTASSSGNRITDAGAASALVLHPRDNVATALCALQAGHAVALRGGEARRTVMLNDAVPLCHKFALRDIADGDVVTKYGEAIGHATRAIRAGDHVHIHNLVSARGR